MAQMKLHNKGPKVERDRAYAMKKYNELTNFFWWKPKAKNTEIAKLTPQQIYRLAEDYYNALKFSEKRKYAETLGYAQRSNPLAFKWFVHDLFRFSNRPWLWLVISCPFRYPRFVKRMKERRQAEIDRQMEAHAEALTKAADEARKADHDGWSSVIPAKASETNEAADRG